MTASDNPSSAYHDLALRLDSIPNGFPATQTGSELRLLAKLYTPQQAALAAQLRLTPEDAATIAARAKLRPSDASSMLKDMARAGLISVERGTSGLRFGLLPFVVGVYEAQLPRMDQELAQLFEAYFVESFGREVLNTLPSLHRIIPVEHSIGVDVEIFPYERASQLLEGANSFGVRDCICRVQKNLIGEGCAKPVGNCIVFHPVENAFQGSRSIRTVTKQEALQILQHAAAHGLVHSSANVQIGHSYICNCCTCCCGILRGLSEFGNADAMARSAFRSEVDVALCALCGTCVDACPFGALSLGDATALVDADRCLGCGICAEQCPSGALSLERRAEGESATPPPDQAAWLAERARSRHLVLESI